MTTVAPLPLTLSEASFQRTVIDLARWYGWLVHHSRPARQGQGWATALTGNPGLPDLVLARRGVVILAELKRHGAKPSQAQRAWLAELGDAGRLWKPSDWAAICAELSGVRPGETPQGETRTK